MKLTINQDYFRRHLFVTVLMAALGCWFGYDGFVKYPATPAAELYAAIEKSQPDPKMTGEELEAFKAQKTHTQWGFTGICFLAALIIGLRLRSACAFKFEFDANGFTWRGHNFKNADIQEIDEHLWEKKSIIVLKLRSGVSVTLDAWHHHGVKEFLAGLKTGSQASPAR